MFQNAVLQALDAVAIARLDLRPVELRAGFELEVPGHLIQRLYFVERGLNVVTKLFKNGSQVEVGMLGSESMSGVAALFGAMRSSSGLMTQIDGHGYAATVGKARLEFQRGGHFQDLTLRVAERQLAHSMQLAACNMKHPVEQRLAQWLLSCADRIHSNTFHMSQESLAQSLGTRRSTVCGAASLLQEDGLIAYNRTRIVITDRAGLEKRACECYAAMKQTEDVWTNHGDLAVQRNSFDNGVDLQHL